MYVTNVDGEKVSAPTEHIIQLAIAIDDGKIIAGVEEAAKSRIIKDIQTKLEYSLFNLKYYGRPEINEGDPREWVRKQFDDFLEAHTDQIIECAGKILADKLSRSKAGKALLEQN